MPSVVGIYLLVTGLSWSLVILLVLFCLVGFVLLPADSNDTAQVARTRIVHGERLGLWRRTDRKWIRLFELAWFKFGVPKRTQEGPTAVRPLPCATRMMTRCKGDIYESDKYGESR